MVVPSGAVASVPLMHAATAALPSSLLLSDAFDMISGFAGSPLILLLPIGAGTLVASIIIFILVKSAG